MRRKNIKEPELKLFSFPQMRWLAVVALPKELEQQDFDTKTEI